ncbi:hybrid sensor histidine kinase/response regulator [Herbaspirillum sp. HC18]|nr:hybrid sensor histidine kinase/response regulator [Herbaspirillum sp. HC18]
MADALEGRILIFAPTGKDGELASRVLTGAGLSCFVCGSLPELLRELTRGAGAILTVEEAVAASEAATLGEYVARQPAWSDIPILMMTRSGPDSQWTQEADKLLGNLTLIDRPVRKAALVSSMRSALRARARQYEVRDAERHKDEFLAMLGHELRNPLAPISSASELLKRAYFDPQRVQQANDIICRQMEHMTSLIDDLLDVSRVTRGLITLENVPLHLQGIVSTAVEQVSPLINARGHRLTLNLLPGTAMVLADRKRLVQVVANLLTNAAKYTPQGGNIGVRLEAEEEQAVLEVSDNGIGMTPGLISHVFELFIQGERRSDRTQGGLGLGLALVKSLVALHGGTVAAESKGLGAGSTFTIRLPLLGSEDVAASANEQATAAASASVSPLRVMIVDDNIDAADTLKLLLESAGYEVVVEYSAIRAVVSARSILPQVCLLDIGLPHINGNELARQLRAMPEIAGSVLIAVTGYGREQDKKESAAAGYDHHFVKPIDCTKLLALLAEIDAR